ncbi:hypothetical protein B5S30_g1986 [[Candida] boidinii]|nr:hypothetical protein B5S30_g1986 [[Candida] boidinii]
MTSKSIPDFDLALVNILSKLIPKLEENYKKTEKAHNSPIKQNCGSVIKSHSQTSSQDFEIESYDSTPRVQASFSQNLEVPHNQSIVSYYHKENNANIDFFNEELKNKSKRNPVLLNKKMENRGSILSIPEENIDSSSLGCFTYKFYQANESFFQIYGIDRNGTILNNDIIKELNTRIKYDLIDMNNLKNIENDINNVLKICRYLIQWRCKTAILPLKLVRYLLKIFKFFLVKLIDKNEAKTIKIDFEKLESLFIVYNNDSRRSEKYYEIYDLIINFYYSTFKYYFEHSKIHNDSELYETILSRILKFIQFLILSKLSNMELLQLPNNKYCYEKSPMFQTVITKSFRRNRGDKNYIKLRKSYSHKKIDSEKIYTIIYYLVKLIQKIWGSTAVDKMPFFQKLRFELLASLTFYEKYDLIRIVLNLT